MFPSVLKPSKVVPIYKKGSSFDMTNYRPIYLLPIFGKLAEKIYYHGLSSFTEFQIANLGLGKINTQLRQLMNWLNK